MVQRFSSIVGPNGSGKSNVIDALLFVFGKRAKQIRLKKLAELIHKSSKYPNLTQCRVSVHFQDIIAHVSHGAVFLHLETMRQLVLCGRTTITTA